MLSNKENASIFVNLDPKSPKLKPVTTPRKNSLTVQLLDDTPGKIINSYSKKFEVERQQSGIDAEKVRLRTWEKELYNLKSGLDQKTKHFINEEKRIAGLYNDFNKVNENFILDKKEFEKHQIDWRKRRTQQSEQLQDLKLQIQVRTQNLDAHEKELKGREDALKVSHKDLSIRLNALDKCEAGNSAKELQLKDNETRLFQFEKDLHLKEANLDERERNVAEIGKNLDIDKKNLAICEHKIRELRIREIEIDKKEKHYQETTNANQKKIDELISLESRVIKMKEDTADKTRFLNKEKEILASEKVKVSGREKANEELQFELESKQKELETQREMLHQMNTSIHEKANKLAQTKQLLLTREQRVKEAEMDLERQQQRVARSLNGFQTSNSDDLFCVEQEENELKDI